MCMLMQQELILNIKSTAMFSKVPLQHSLWQAKDDFTFPVNNVNHKIHKHQKIMLIAENNLFLLNDNKNINCLEPFSNLILCKFINELIFNYDIIMANNNKKFDVYSFIHV